MPQLITLNNGKKIEVAKKDLGSNSYTSGTHSKLKFKDGWRLPSIEELETIFNLVQQGKLGDFHEDWYWSCSSFQVSWDYYEYLGVNFADGQINAKTITGGSYSLDIGKAFIRLVRNHEVEH